MKENVHQSIIHSNIYIYIYISVQKNYKQTSQLKSNNIHTKKEPHVMITLLFKSHLSKSRGFFLVSLHFVSTIINWKQLELQLHRSILFSTKNFCKKEGKGGRTLPKKLESFWSGI